MRYSQLRVRGGYVRWKRIFEEERDISAMNFRFKGLSRYGMARQALVPAAHVPVGVSVRQGEPVLIQQLLGGQDAGTGRAAEAHAPSSAHSRRAV